MKFKVRGMNIILTESYEEMSKKAASIVTSQVIIKPTSVLGLATGGTPVGMYQEIIKTTNENEVDFSEVVTFNLDEYYPISKNNDQSYAYYMNDNLFNHINVLKENIHIPNGETGNVDVECSAYDQMIYDQGGIDLQVLGIGNNGHIGFNEPDVHFESGTHKVELDEETIEANARFFETKEAVPKQAISMGIRTIMHSRKIILLASGASKAEVIEKMLFGDISPNVPASILQLHNDVTIILDEAAAANIRERLA